MSETQAMPPKVILPMIRRGEFDLVNMSLLGHDPITGRTYQECHSEWKAAFDYLQWRMHRTQWWQVWLVVANRWQLLNLSLRMGMQ